MRTAPALAPGGLTRSPGNAVFDPFWTRAAAAGVVVAFHSGDAGYGKYLDDWEPGGDFQAFQFSALRTMTSDRAPFDMFAVLVCHGVFSRHPELRCASIRGRVLFGSDYPHAEGLAVPNPFVHDLKGFDAGEVRAIMRDNAYALIGG